MSIKTMKAVDVLEPVSNGAEPFISTAEPYAVRVTIEGISPILFHAWNNEAVEAKGTAAKNSKAKKTDDLESYVYRHENGNLAIPGEYLRQSIINAARFRQDPRSPRKSAMDLFKAAVFALTEYADLDVATWEYVDRRRAVVQRSAITRARPALRQGWRCTIDLLVNLPEYVDSQTLLETIGTAGRLIGIADNRPTYGRFAVVGYEVMKP